jgi:hypothetical protein
MNASTVGLLQEIVRRESRSMLTYVGEAFPWTPSREADTLARLKDIIAAHNEAVAALGRYLTKLREPLGYLGSYPSHFTTINFLSLDHILPKLVVSERANVAALQGDVAKIGSDKDARAQAENLLEVKKKQLEKLEFLSEAHSSGVGSQESGVKDQPSEPAVSH